MKNKQVLELYQKLNNKLLESLRGVKLLYAIDRNYLKIESEVKSLERSREPSKEYKEYDEKRNQINIDHCEKTKTGEPKTISITKEYFQYVIDKEKQDIYREKMTALEGKYKDVIDKRKNELKDFDNLLEEDSEFEPYYIDHNFLPEDIEWKVYQLLKDLIKKDSL